MVVVVVILPESPQTREEGVCVFVRAFVCVSVSSRPAGVEEGRQTTVGLSITRSGERDWGGGGGNGEGGGREEKGGKEGRKRLEGPHNFVVTRHGE